VHVFIGRHLDELAVCRSPPQEDLRMAVSRVHFDKYIDLLKIRLTGKVTQLEFNLDEVGPAHEEDRETKKVIAPAAVRKEECIIPYLVPTVM
jgi:hypothetical protein